ncbi:hypothetical protein NDU88_005690 [Pleurodeles waltl]|uniref:Uncharacterized protein n=1 Tax=Pleurodeles waltl TaxID=8319 RepID=A0AAV7LLX4_PLEWA|nr:hypothetical protein NDU88_005690 [Pleurodeles waltl]
MTLLCSRESEVTAWRLQQDPASHLHDPLCLFTELRMKQLQKAKGAWSLTILRDPSPALIAPAVQDPASASVLLQLIVGSFSSHTDLPFQRQASTRLAT